MLALTYLTYLTYLLVGYCTALFAAQLPALVDS